MQYMQCVLVDDSPTQFKCSALVLLINETSLANTVKDMMLEILREVKRPGKSGGRRAKSSTVWEELVVDLISCWVSYLSKQLDEGFNNFPDIMGEILTPRLDLII
jgi:hypothetical protein